MTQKKSDKLWSGRFKKALDPKVESFNSSLHFDYALYEYDILGSKVHVEMLAKQNLISELEAQQIIGGLEVIRSNFDKNQCNWQEAEDIHTLIESLLIEQIGDVAKKVHTGRSRNDQVALDLRLYARDVGSRVQESLLALIIVLQEISQRHASDKMPGYTHMQQAQPVSLGYYLGAYVAMLQRDLSRLGDWHERMNFSPLGAGAFAGSNLPLDRHYVAAKLNFKGIIDNTVDAVSDRDYIIEFCSLASICMMHLSRFSEDLIIWATQEFNFVTMDDSVSTGSSLMPNKKNPDVVELIRGKSGRVFGHLMAILTVMKGLPLAYNKDMQEDKEAFFDTANTLLACTEVMPIFLKGLKFNTDVMLRSLETGYTNATEILELLILKGTPFRDAHHTVGQWILESIENGTNIKQLLDDYLAHVAQKTE